MGLRTPSKFKVFGAQAKAGAEQQKEARENLKKPGEATKSALGGMGSAGTGMVAATTGAQQSATKKLNETSTEMGETVSASMIPVASGSQTSNVYTTANATTPTAVTAVSGEGGDVQSTTNVVTQLTENINNVQKQIDDLTTAISNASAADAKALTDKKTELENTLKNYMAKLNEENLGQIAGQSQAEIDAEKQAIIMAQRGGGNVSKLATVFGGRREITDPALASQIYGKDLELLQPEAAAALEASERAKTESEEQIGAYSERGKQIKTDVEEAVTKEQEKLTGLKEGYEGLRAKGYTDDQIIELYGDDVDKYFKVETDKDGNITKITGDNISATKKALADTKKSLEDQKVDAEKDVTRAQQVETKQLDSSYQNINKIVEDITGWGGWIGEQGSKKLAPISETMKNLVADFREKESTFKTPEERQDALVKLRSDIEVQKGNVAGELAAFLGDTNTNFWDAAKAAQTIIDNDLMAKLPESTKQVIKERMDREMIKLSVRRNKGAYDWAGKLYIAFGGEIPVVQ